MLFIFPGLTEFLVYSKRFGFIGIGESIHWTESSLFNLVIDQLRLAVRQELFRYRVSLDETRLQNNKTRYNLRFSYEQGGTGHLANDQQGSETKEMLWFLFRP